MKKILILIGVFLLLGLGSANATMTEFVTYTAEGAGISVDAKGLDTNVEGTIRASIPAGSSVYKAYLYSADVWGNGLSNVVFEGNTLVSNASSRLDVGVKQGNPASENRWDVTSIVQTKVGGGGGPLFSFSLKELGYLDGEILAVIYSDPTKTKPKSTAFILDGELSSAGDSFSISLSKPVDKSDPNFVADLSLGISFGYQEFGGNQRSLVDVNGQRLTSSAGGEDDGFHGNGGLITAGGIDDSNTNPADPMSGPVAPLYWRYDDELYSLTPFLKDGATVINFSTSNPSFDDNVFFTAFSTLGEAHAGGEVPEPATMILLGSGLLGLAGYARKRMKK